MPIGRLDACPSCCGCQYWDGDLDNIPEGPFEGTDLLAVEKGPWTRGGDGYLWTTKTGATLAPAGKRADGDGVGIDVRWLFGFEADGDQAILRVNYAAGANHTWVLAERIDAFTTRLSAYDKRIGIDTLLDHVVVVEDTMVLGVQVIHMPAGGTDYLTVGPGLPETPWIQAPVPLTSTRVRLAAGTVTGRVGQGWTLLRHTAATRSDCAQIVGQCPYCTPDGLAPLAWAVTLDGILQCPSGLPSPLNGTYIVEAAGNCVWEHVLAAPTCTRRYTYPLGDPPVLAYQYLPVDRIQLELAVGPPGKVYAYARVIQSAGGDPPGLPRDAYTLATFRAAIPEPLDCFAVADQVLPKLSGEDCQFGVNSCNYTMGTCSISAVG